MGASISWTNHVLSDLDRRMSIVGTTTTLVEDPLHPLWYAIDTDPSKDSRINFTNTSGSNRTVGFRSAFSASNNKIMRTASVVNMRLPANTISVTFTALNAAGASLHSVVIPFATFTPMPGTTDRYNFNLDLTADRTGAMFEVLITIPTGTTDYVGLGYMWVGPALILPDGVDGDWQQFAVDGSETERLRGGAFSSNVLPKRRGLTVNFSDKQYALIMGTPGNAAALSFQRFLLECGKSSPCVVIPRLPALPHAGTAQENHEVQVLAMHCSVTALPPLSHGGGNIYKASACTFEEIR